MSERWWHGLQVIEAKKPISIHVLPKDIKGAVQQNVDACVFARAIQRMFENRHVSFWKSKAYLELPQEGGSSKAMRYVLPKAMSAVIALFDKTGQCPIDGFTLLPPPPSETLAAKARQRKRDRKRLPAKRQATKPMTFTDKGLVRNGAGHVRFASEAPQSPKAAPRRRHRPEVQSAV